MNGKRTSFIGLLMVLLGWRVGECGSSSEGYGTVQLWDLAAEDIRQ